MKKIILIFLAIFTLSATYGCTQKEKLFVMNWSDYLDPDLIDDFEKEFNVKVSYKQVGSNEEMASLLQAGNAVYDLAFPSEYMVDKLIQEELIQTINYDLIPNLELLSVIPKLDDLYSETDISGYIVPYAWGTIGILYRTDVEGLEELLLSEDWDALFKHGETYRTGILDSPRDAIGAALMALGYNVNSDDSGELAEAEALLINANVYAWGEDTLKSRVIDGTVDMALVYSGDYFSEYYSAIYDEREVNFSFYVPETTNVWMDSIVIPTISANYELAHTFINFLLREEVALQNYEYIGYAPPYQTFYDQIFTQIQTDFGPLAAAFDPFPDGSSREMYQYGSSARSQSLIDILQRAKAGN